MYQKRGGLSRAAPHNSARDGSERFCPKIKFGKRRNTLCTRKGYAASVSQLALATAALYFKFFKLRYWGKRSAAVRRRNYAVLPKKKAGASLTSECQNGNTNRQLAPAV